jgi:death-on-curing protein
MEAFLNLNGVVLKATDPEIVVVILALAAGELDEEELAGWLRERIG